MVAPTAVQGDPSAVPGQAGRPVKRVSQPILFEKIGYRPHAGQDEILRSSVRNQVVAAGRRFGKSDLGGHRLITECFVTYYARKQLESAGKRREFWVVGPEYSDSEKEFRVLYDNLKRLEVPFDKPGTYNNPQTGDMHISLWDGRFLVNALSAKYPDTLVGEGLSGVILAEAAKLKERVWTKYIRPTLADFKGWALLTSTPEGKNWFYDRWQAGQNSLIEDWASWRRPSWSNPYVYPQPTVLADVLRMQKLMRLDSGIPAETAMAMMDQLAVDSEIRALMQDMSEIVFNQEIAALFTEFVGRVFKEFDEEVHVRNLTFDPSWETYAAVDYGFTNPNVWLLIQVGPWGDVHVLDEVYERGLTPDEFADMIMARGLAPSNLRAFYPDPASPGDTKILERKLRVKARGGTGGELRHRIDAIRKALKDRNTHVPQGHPERTPQLTIDTRCTNVIREFNDYRYPDKRSRDDTNTVEQPMKKDDHTPEALGRFFAGHFGTPQQVARRARVRDSSLAG